MNCPKCGSENWKLASLIHAEGTMKTESLTLGGGGAVGEKSAIPLLGGGLTFGTQQSDLAKMAAPPEKNSFRSPKLPTPVANASGKKGLILSGAGILGMLINDYVDSLLLVLLVLLVTLSGLFYLLRALHLLIFGAEAVMNRKIKIEAKNKWNELNAMKLKEYESLRICMRCGHRYL